MPLIYELAGSWRDLFFVKYRSGQRQINLIYRLYIYIVELSMLGKSVMSIKPALICSWFGSSFLSPLITGLSVTRLFSIS